MECSQRRSAVGDGNGADVKEHAVRYAQQRVPCKRYTTCAATPRAQWGPRVFQPLQASSVDDQAHPEGDLYIMTWARHVQRNREGKQ